MILIGIESYVNKKEVIMSSYTKTKSYTQSFTKTRISVLDDHFEMFLRCANMSDAEVEKLLNAVEKHEIEAVGVYLQEGEYRIAEVEFNVNWEKHQTLLQLSGDLFDTDIGGWKDGVSPEAYIPVQHLVKASKKLNLPVRSWIRVSSAIRKNPTKHKLVCNELGYCFGGGVPPWKSNPNEKTRNIQGLAEANVVSREINI